MSSIISFYAAELMSIENKFKPSSSSGNHGYSQGARSSPPPTPSLILPHEHSLAFRTNGENHNNHQNQAEPSSYQLFQPFREDVKNTLNRVTPTNLNRFASAYFDHSERTSHLLCILLESISQARLLYIPPHNLLNAPSLDSPLSENQVELASNVFLQFNIHENPFPLRISQNFQEIILCIGAINQKLPSRLIWNSSSSLYDLIVGVYDLIVRSERVNYKISSLSLYDLIARGSSVLKDDVNIIDRLVTQLQAVVESDKLMVRTGLERGKDRYPLQEMVEQVRKNRTYFLDNLHDLKSHIYLCFWTLNKVRSLLLSAILLNEKPIDLEPYHSSYFNPVIPTIQALKEVFYRLKPTDFMQLLVAFDLNLLSQSIKKASSLYAPLRHLLTILPLNSPLSQSQCNQAYYVFLQLNHLLENPFDSCISQTLTELKQLLFPFKVRLSAPYAFADDDVAQLKDYLPKIEEIICQLQIIAEEDTQMIRILLESGRNIYATGVVIEQLVIEQLRKNVPIVWKQLMELQENVSRFSVTIKRLTSFLLEEILLQERL